MNNKIMMAVAVISVIVGESISICAGSPVDSILPKTCRDLDAILLEDGPLSRATTSLLTSASDAMKMPDNSASHDFICYSVAESVKLSDSITKQIEICKTGDTEKANRYQEFKEGYSGLAAAARDFLRIHSCSPSD